MLSGRAERNGEAEGEPGTADDGGALKWHGLTCHLVASLSITLVSLAGAWPLGHIAGHTAPAAGSQAVHAHASSFVVKWHPTAAAEHDRPPILGPGSSK